MHAFEARVVVHVLKAFVSSISVARQGLIDHLVDIMFGSHRCSEMDTFPQTNFSKGCTHLKQLHAFEWPGMLLIFLVLTQSYQGYAILKSRFDDNDLQYQKKVQQAKAKKDNDVVKQICFV